MTLENGSGTNLKHQGKRHHRLALVLLPLPLPLPLDAAADARSVHTLTCMIVYCCTIIYCTKELHLKYSPNLNFGCHVYGFYRRSESLEFISSSTND